VHGPAAPEAGECRGRDKDDRHVGHGRHISTNDSPGGEVSGSFCFRIEDYLARNSPKIARNRPEASIKFAIDRIDFYLGLDEKSGWVGGFFPTACEISRMASVIFSIPHTNGPRPASG
jgi:hypothetical protein